MTVRSEYDRQLAEMNSDLEKMGQLAMTSMEQALEAVKKQDTNVTEEILHRDETIDELERRVSGLCLDMILRQQPVAAELRRISAAIKVITDMERMGDHAVDIAEIMGGTGDCGEETRQSLLKMGRAAIDMARAALAAFAVQDVAAAQATIEKDDTVDAGFDEVKHLVTHRLAEDPGRPDDAIDALMMAKYLERLGDNAVNICYWTIFCKTGVYRTEKLL